MLDRKDIRDKVNAIEKTFNDPGMKHSRVTIRYTFRDENMTGVCPDGLELSNGIKNDDKINNTLIVCE